MVGNLAGIARIQVEPSGCRKRKSGSLAGLAGCMFMRRTGCRVARLGRPFGLALSAMLSAAPAVAHTDGQSPGPHDFWTAWSLDPFVIAPMVVATVLYVRGVWYGWSRAGFGRGVTIGQTVAFAGGMIALILSLVWPLDAMGESLFAGHMAQHIVLMGVAAPLLVYGAPLPTMIRSLPRPLQRFSAVLVRQSAWRVAWRWLSSLLLATMLQLIAVGTWHLPSAIAASLTSDAVHALMHSSLFIAALLFWSAIARHGDRDLWPVAALLVTGKLFLIFGALLTFSKIAFYPAYAGRPQAWGYSLLEDQQLAGALMMVPGAMMFLMLPIIYVALWLVRLDRSQEQMAGSRPNRPKQAGLTG